MSSIFSIISAPFGWVMKFIYDYVGNYGVSLILFTLVTKIILLPLAVKQKKSTIRMSAFQPMIQNIQKKYANNPQKQNEELARLQTEHGFSMTSGCLPTLIQLPILIGLVEVIYKPLTHILSIPAGVISAVEPVAETVLGSLSRYSPQSSIIAAVKSSPRAFSSLLSEAEMSAIQAFDATFLGMDLTAIPSLKVFNRLLLIPVLSGVFMLINNILMMKLNGQTMTGSAKLMPLISVAMFVYFAFIMPAGASIYFMFSSIFGILQDLLLRLFFDPEKEKKKIEEEIAAARKARKEKEKARPAKASRAIKSDKYVEEEYEGRDADLIKKRLEKARALDKERYGD